MYCIVTYRFSRLIYILISVLRAGASSLPRCWNANMSVPLVSLILTLLSVVSLPTTERLADAESLNALTSRQDTSCVFIPDCLPTKIFRRPKKLLTKCILENCGILPVQRPTKRRKRGYVCAPLPSGEDKQDGLKIQNDDGCVARLMFLKNCIAWFECRCSGKVIAQQTIGGTGVSADLWRACHIRDFPRGGAAACGPNTANGFTLANAVVNLPCSIFSRGSDYCYCG